MANRSLKLRYILTLALTLLVATAHAEATGDPSLPKFTPAEMRVIQAALAQLLKDEPGEAERIRGVMRPATGVVPFGQRDFPMIGLALSRASKDLAACALLQKIQPVAVCVK